MKFRLSGPLAALFPAAGPDAPEAYRLVRRNWLLYVLSLSGWLAGLSFYSVGTILPVFAYRLTGSTLVVSLIPALFEGFAFLPALFMAPYVERRPHVLPLALWLGGIQRVFYLLLALSVGWMAGLPSEAARAAFLIVLACLCLSNGLPSAAGTELMTRLMPLSHRGRLVGSALLVGQVFNVGGAQIAALILARLPYPANFTWSFLVGSLFLWLSQLASIYYKEPAAVVSHSSRAAGDFIRRLARILRQNANYRSFLASRGLSYFGNMGAGFIAVYAVRRFGVPDAVSAVFAGILAAGGSVGFGLWGALGDRWGYKRVLELAAPLWLLALGLVLIAPNVGLFYVAFFLQGLASTGNVMADLSMAMEFGPDADRVTYISLARTFVSLPLLTAPVVGGWIAETWGYPAMLMTSLALAALGLAVMVVFVREPRHLPPPR